MPDLESVFNAAVESVKKLPTRPDNDTLLRLYGLYKQASEGDVSGKKPGMLDFKGVAKYEAWQKLQGTSSEDAMQDYVALVRQLTD
jgi:acyl-CoA-binding protein